MACVRSLNRRTLVGSALTAGALAGLPWSASAAEAPWEVRPAADINKLSMVVWSYGNIYSDISAKFKADWGVPVEATVIPFPDQPNKLMTMYAAGDHVDVSQTSPFSMANFVEQDVIEPLDSLPGEKEYLTDFTPLARQANMFNRKLMALPFLSAVWAWNYNTELLDKINREPFRTYDELLDQARKAKRDNVSEFPILWVAGAGTEQLAGTWYQLTWNRGGAFFDKNGKPELGPGSIARETLRWFGKTFADGLSDPGSLKMQQTTSAATFSAGHNLYRGPSQHFGLSIINDPARSSIAGKVKIWGSPGDGKTIGSTHSVFLTTATRNKEWGWKLLQYLGGKTRDGKYTMAETLARTAMFLPGYTSLLNSHAIAEGWKKWCDPQKLLEIMGKATYVGEVCNSIYHSWHLPWSDQLNIEVQKVLIGESDADQCCDRLVTDLKQVQKS